VDALKLDLASKQGELRLMVRGLREKEGPRDYQVVRLSDLGKGQGESAAPTTDEEKAPLPARPLESLPPLPAEEVKKPPKPVETTPVEPVRPPAPETHRLLLDNSGQLGIKEYTKGADGKWMIGNEPPARQREPGSKSVH